MSPLVLALALGASSPGAVPAPVLAAVGSALALSGAHAEVLELRGDLPAGCGLRRAEVLAPVASSGRAAVHLLGADLGCDAWAWARVRVTAPVLVTTRAVAAGAPLDGATESRPREVLQGHAVLSTLPDGAVAERDLAPGTPLEPTAVRVGPRPGDPVSVVLRVGDLTLEQTARALPCRRGRACALLPSGRRVEGTWHGGRIELERP